MQRGGYAQERGFFHCFARLPCCFPARTNQQPIPYYRHRMDSPQYDRHRHPLRIITPALPGTKTMS